MGGNRVWTHLLDSWMRAMAMRILFRRKMTVSRMIASAMEMMITETHTHTLKDHSRHTAVTCGVIS